MKMTITKTTAPKTKPDSAKLGFGKYFTDHMFIMDYTEVQGWHDARIEPYHDPFALPRLDGFSIMRRRCSRDSRRIARPTGARCSSVRTRTSSG